MAIVTKTIHINTSGDAHILDITGQVRQEVASSGIAEGAAIVFSPSSTSALTTIEFEPGALSDFKRLFDEIIPPDRPYAHDAAWGDGNGHSHVRAALLGPSLTIPINDRRVTLGTWQQIIFVDFDNKPRQRKLVIQIMGE